MKQSSKHTTLAHKEVTTKQLGEKVDKTLENKSDQKGQGEIWSLVSFKQRRSELIDKTMRQGLHVQIVLM